LIAGPRTNSRPTNTTKLTGTKVQMLMDSGMALVRVPACGVAELAGAVMSGRLTAQYMLVV